MSDIALIWNPALGMADFGLTGNDYTPDDGLQTAILLSLGTDRAAEDGDLPASSKADRRGWWGDLVPVVVGDKFGSRLWLLDRSKKTNDVLPRAEDYATEALQWLINDKVAVAINVSADWFVSPQTQKVIGYVITGSATRPNGTVTNFKFDHVWQAEGAR